MATIPIRYFSYEVVEIEADDEKVVMTTKAFIDKLREVVRRPPHGEPYERGELFRAMFMSDPVILKAVAHIWGEKFHTWKSGGLMTDEVDIGSMVGRRMRLVPLATDPDDVAEADIEKEGTVVRERPVEYEGHESTEFTAETDRGESFLVQGHYGNWHVRVGDSWYDAHGLVKLVRAERAGAKTAERLNRRRPSVRVRRHWRRR